MPGINDRIKEMRLKKGLTLLEVAEHIGVKEATVQRYESGSIKNIKHEIICKLSDLFDCDPCYLMGWSASIVENSTTGSTITNSAVAHGNNATAMLVHSGELSEQAIELLRIFETLSVKDQTALLSFAYDLEENSK